MRNDFSLPRLKKIESFKCLTVADLLPQKLTCVAHEKDPSVLEKFWKQSLWKSLGFILPNKNDLGKNKEKKDCSSLISKQG